MTSAGFRIHENYSPIGDGDISKVGDTGGCSLQYPESKASSRLWWKWQCGTLRKL